MKTTVLKHQFAGLLACAAVLLSALTVRADAEDRIKKTFSVNPGGQLTVRADRGSITVTTTEANSVDVEVIRKVKGASDAKAETMFKDHEVTFSQDGNSVEVTAKYKRELRFWEQIWNRFQVQYLIAIPKKFNLDLKTAGGAITVADLTGKVRVETAGGSLKLASIDGSVWGKTAGGSIALAAGTGDVEVKTSGGSINVGEVAGKLTAGTAGGSITVQKALGDAFLKTSGGSINVEEVVGALDADTSGGSIKIKQAGKSVVARTSGGGIQVSGVKGTLDASTSGGSITGSFAMQPEGDCQLKTSGGSITVYLKDSLAFNVNAKTSGGRVVTELPVTVQGEHKSSSLQGKLNGGGPALFLHTSAGSIHLRKL
jgi:DUF4097 and DUF4098 domain-containing protein YvlB